MYKGVLLLAENGNLLIAPKHLINKAGRATQKLILLLNDHRM
jgi:hypothetical protein